MRSQSDKDIVRSTISGDHRAGAELVRRYADRGFALAIRILRNREDAEEAVQDAFLRVFRSLERFEWKSSFATWFYRIVYNVSVTAAQRRGIPLVYATDDPPFLETFTAPGNLPDGIAEGEELDRIVRAEIEALPPASALILTLFLLEEQSYDEIVSITGLPLGTVKNRLFRARALLREAVLARYHDSPRATAADTAAPQVRDTIDSRTGDESIISCV